MKEINIKKKVKPCNHCGDILLVECYAGEKRIIDKQCCNCCEFTRIIIS